MRTPVEYVTASYRLLDLPRAQNAERADPDGAMQACRMMGQFPMAAPSPKGWSDISAGLVRARRHPVAHRMGPATGRAAAPEFRRRRSIAQLADQNLGRKPVAGNAFGLTCRAQWRRGAGASAVQPRIPTEMIMNRLSPRYR